MGTEMRAIPRTKPNVNYNRATPPISAEQAADDAAPLFAPEAEQATGKDEKPAKPAPAIVLSFTTIYRGRQITITGEHMTIDQFCDLLDRRLPL